MWPTRRDHIDGRLTLIKQHSVMFLAWLPYTHGTLNQDGTFSATPQPSSSARPSAPHSGTSSPPFISAPQGKRGGGGEA